MIIARTLAATIAALAVVACSKAPEPASSSPAARADAATSSAPPAAAAHAEHAIAWEEGDVDAAFAKAKAAGKPLFLYWGAVWGPPCNEVKATIFTRRDFIERARQFVPVYVDGDAKGAQKLGARFKVSGYPTMVLFTPDGREITRLPGEVEADRYMQVLALAMSGTRPVRETLATALGKDASALRPEDWRMLAWYSWVTDEQQLVDEDRRPAMLARLAKACPAGDTQVATRLALQAQAAAAKAKGAKPRDDKAAVALLRPLLADPARVREHFDLVVDYADDIAGHVTLPKSPERRELVAAWSAALAGLAADRELAELDRLTALTAEVALAKLDAPTGAVPPGLQQRVRDEAGHADRDTQDPYARQSVISAAAEVLTDAGLVAESDALLEAELARSHSPYYFMLGLAFNAKERGDKAAAVDWAEKAYAAAQGPATRLQWGARYVSLLIELTPQDTARIEKAAAQVIAELEPVPETFYERNERSLERIGKSLAKWSRDPARRATVQHLRAEMAAVCAKVPAGDPARTNCEGALKPLATKKA